MQPPFNFYTPRLFNRGIHCRIEALDQRSCQIGPVLLGKTERLFEHTLCLSVHLSLSSITTQELVEDGPATAPNQTVNVSQVFSKSTFARWKCTAGGKSSTSGLGSP